MRNSPLRGLVKSPLHQEYKNTKTAPKPTGPYSPENTEGNVGNRLVKGFMTAVAPTSVVELFPGVKQFKKLSNFYKVTKAVVNLNKGKNKS